jgi:predicted ArsR family transcriptional regulator
MEVRLQGKGGPVVANVEDMVQHVQQQLQDQQGQWVAQLRDQPATFADLEAHIHRTFQNLADHVVAGVLAQATAGADFAKEPQKK